MQAFRHDIVTLPEALAEKVDLLPELLVESRSSGTVKNYFSSFMRWKVWARANGISEDEILPAKAFHVALYLASLVQCSRSPSPVISAFYALKWAHNFVSAAISPTDSELVKNVLEGAKRRLSVATCKKEPITPELLEKMYDNLFSIDNLYNQRTITVCLVAYAGFFRISELLNLKLADVQMFDTHMALFIEKGKTDVYRDGNWVVISRTNSKLCPVRNFERYLNMAGLNSDDSFLFQNLVKCKDIYILRSSNRPMTYSRMREVFIEAFLPLVPDIKKYGLHSLRAGGATSAANRGVPDRLFKRIGRWRSEKAKDGYVKDELSERLSVSKSLGI